MSSSTCSRSSTASRCYDQNVASYLELLQVPYTGCNPRGLMLARGKDLSKTLVAYHRIHAGVCRLPDAAQGPAAAAAQFPLIVKSLSEDASLGIAQASVVDTDEKLAERVAFIHERIGTAAIAEQYIEGRELYVGVLGNDRLHVFRSGSWSSAKARPGPTASPRLASSTIPVYQERRGILQGPAEDLAPELEARIQRIAKRIYRTLALDGYARIDFRLSPMGVPYFIEANPNPEIAIPRSSPRRPSMTASTTPPCSSGFSRSASGARRRAAPRTPVPTSHRRPPDCRARRGW
jgi:D-alanine-D-alanine ligase